MVAKCLLRREPGLKSPEPYMCTRHLQCELGSITGMSIDWFQFIPLKGGRIQMIIDIALSQTCWHACIYHVCVREKLEDINCCWALSGAAGRSLPRVCFQGLLG
jgi:hypothetical protein